MTALRQVAGDLGAMLGAVIDDVRDHFPAGCGERSIFFLGGQNLGQLGLIERPCVRQQARMFLSPELPDRRKVWERPPIRI